MRIISFNVNGIRSMMGKIKNGEKNGTAADNVIRSLILEQTPDILCLQEIKTQSTKDIDWLHEYYAHVYTTFATKKGYSGVALLCRTLPEWVENGFYRYPESVVGEYISSTFHQEGRILVAKFANIIVIGVYTPNSKEGLARLSERVHWERILRMYIMELRREFELPIVLCGDLNCAQEEIDLYNPRGSRMLPGFSDPERRELRFMIGIGMIDSFRHFHPTRAAYSYFSHFGQARAKNRGWRIDYILVSDATLLESADILGEYAGSDHVPVVCDLKE